LLYEKLSGLINEIKIPDMNLWKNILYCQTRLLILLLFLSVPRYIYPQDPVKVTKIAGGINFDGVPDEEVWEKIPAMKFTMHVPVFGNKPTDSLVIKIAYDDSFFYLSGIMNYSDPSLIRAIGKKRDYSMPYCDWLGIILDSFNDRQNAVGFFTNPNGLRTDATIKNDAISQNDDINFSWNTFWDVKVIKDSSRWSAEFRIPFSSLRFQVKDGQTRMGLIIWYYFAGKSELDTYPPVSPDFQNAYWKPSLTSTLVFEGLKPKNPLYLTPYATSGFSQTNEIDQAENAYKVKTTPKFDAGLDAKFSFTNNLTMDLTLNTDFAQVEADDQKINLTRFSLFFPEKRVFFQEKSDVFDFAFLSGGDNLFYSRRIGIYDGNPVRIYGGARLTGRINKWDLGILDMQTAPFETNPGENFGVLRTKRTIFNQGSYIGGMFTSRLGMNGAYNLAYGIDGQFRVVGDEYFNFKLAQTFEKDSLNKVFDLSPTKVLLRWERRNLNGFSYDLLYTFAGDRFNPGIGFLLKEHYQGVRGILQYGWLPGENAIIRHNSISLTGTNIWNTATGQQETSSAILKWLFDGKIGFVGSVSGTWNREDLADTLTLGNDQAFVPPGRYIFTTLSAMYTTPTINSLSANFLAEAGRFYDGWKVSLSASPTLNVGTGLYLGLTYNMDFVNFPSREIKFTNHIAGLKTELTLTTKASLTAFIQYNTAIDKVLTNIRFRYNPREGNDFYIVYDEGLNTRMYREVPPLPFSDGRTVLLKYTYTFRFTR
jgi:hypothetical protein